MRLFGIILPTILSLLFSLAFAQQPPATPTTPAPRDAQALTNIQSTLTALGGVTAIAQLNSAIITGSITSAPGANAPEGTFVWEDLFAAGTHEFRDSFQSAALNQIFVSGHGTPGFVSNGHLRTCYPEAGQYRFTTHVLGPVLANAIANSNVSLTWVGPATLNGQSANRIHFEADTDAITQKLSQQDWYFDPQSGLPLRIEYRVPDAQNPTKFTSAAVDLSDFRVVQGVLVPFHLVAYDDAKPRFIITVSSATFNQSVPLTDFDLPTALAQ